jgi:hypothetical protein
MPNWNYGERALTERKTEMWAILDVRNKEIEIESKRLEQDLDRFQVLRQKSILMQTHPSLSYSGEGSTTATSFYLRNPQPAFPTLSRALVIRLDPFRRKLYETLQRVKKCTFSQRSESISRSI